MVTDTSYLLGSLYSTGLFFIIKASLLLALGWAFYQLFEKRAAGIRYWILSLTFFALLLLPISHFLLPGWNWGLLPAKTAGIFLPEESDLVHSISKDPIPNGLIDQEVSVENTYSSKRLEQRLDRADTVYPFEQTKKWAAQHWVIFIWFIVSFIFLGKLLFEQLMLSYLLRKNKMVPGPGMADVFENIKKSYCLPQNIRLILSEDFAIPFTYGVYRPTIVLPIQARSWEAPQLEMVLLHELAHIRRKDLLINLMVQFCRALYWWHPLVWHTAKWIRLECEKACDEWVVGQNINPFDYAQQLLNTTRKVKQFRFSAPLAMAETNELRQRIEAIINPVQEQFKKVQRFKRWSLALFILLIIPVACIQLVAEKDSPLYQELSTAPLDEAAALEKLLWKAGTAEDPRLIPAILPSLNHPTANVRTMAAWALGEIKDKNTFQALLPLLKDQNPLVLEMTIRAIGELENTAGIAALQPFLEVEDTVIKIAAIQALADIGQQSALRAIEKYLYERNPTIQHASIYALRESENKAATALILKTWNNNAFSNPIPAIKTLGHLGNQQAVPRLCQALQQESFSIRVEAARALGLIGHNSALDALLAGLRDPSAEVREMVVWALDELNS